MQPVRRAALDQGREPVDDPREEHDHGPERGPEQERDRQDEAEKDRQPRALEVVVDDQAEHTTLEQQLELEAQLQSVATRTDDFREGVAAFLEKREPHFEGR
ncbi:MAG: enoyl-CoA hydratase-related protein [Microvirga sp.]